MTERTLNSKQATLEALALGQLQAVRESLERLQAIPACQADREALADAAELAERGTDCLRDWFGGSPATAFDD